MELYKEHIELTMSIGCASNCSYCPQDVFINEYFKTISSQERITYLTTENAKKWLSKVPKGLMVSMAGFTEPLTSPYFSEIYEWLINEGRVVDINTTLYKVKRDALRTISKVGFGFIQLHLPDDERLTDIVVDREYLSSLKFALAHFNDKRFHVVLTCLGDRFHPLVQEELDKHNLDWVKGYNKGKDYINDRTGNLSKDTFVTEETYNHVGEVYCVKAHRSLNFTNLLPDGRLTLCCMDWGLDNILGDLSKQTYIEILESKKAWEIRDKMIEENNDLICRKCALAVQGKNPAIPDFFIDRALKIDYRREF